MCQVGTQAVVRLDRLDRLDNLGGGMAKSAHLNRAMGFGRVVLLLFALS